MNDARTYSEGEFRLQRLPNGWLVGRFLALEAIGVAHLVTTRQGPDVQRVRQDPATPGREIAQVLGLKEAAFLEQVHGGAVLECVQAGQAGCADGLVTAATGLALLGKSGDCPIILIADRRRRAVGFAHASWRATVAGIAPAVVRRMVDLGCKVDDLVACICPSAGPCCYEVGEEVRAAALQGIGPHAARFFGCAGPSGPAPGNRGVTGSGGRLHFDLWRANTCALARAGLAAGAIHVAGICTLCRNDLFPSHRREGDAGGRFAAVIGWA
jgi:YfiH family protein